MPTDLHHLEFFVNFLAFLCEIDVFPRELTEFTMNIWPLVIITQYLAS